MKRLVADASVILSWFDPAGRHGALRDEYESGMATILGPRNLVPDMLGLLADRAEWSAGELARIATELDRIGLELHDPPHEELAKWVLKGLPPDRAAYPALAASLDLRLVTDDPELRRTAVIVVSPD